jgi:hypothetical protein
MPGPGARQAALPVVEVAESARPGEVVGEQTVRVAPSPDGGLVGPCSPHYQAAVSCECLPGERRRVVSGEHGHHGGGVVGREGTRQRLVRCDVSELGCRTASAGGGASEARSDGGHRDPVAAEPDGERPVIPISAPFDAT